MLTSFSIVLAIVVLFGTVAISIPIFQLIRRLSSSSLPELEDSECPPAAIVLSLRGGDPFLYDCLTRLLEQDYPDYELIIALDHKDDPALQYVNQVIDERNPTNLTKKIICDRPTSCTLLNNNYAQMVQELDERFEFVVFVDADAVTWPGWLRSLVKPMVRDKSIGGTSGNRWYTPDDPSIGALVRTVWNMGSLIQMASLNYPWGGSMALRASIAKSDEMLKRWKSSFTGDTPTFEVIKNAGMKFSFSSDVIVKNRESTNLTDFCNWMPRQMLNGKLYHPLWAPVLLQAVISTIVLVVSFVVNVANLATGNWIGFAYLGGSLTLFWLLVFGSFLKMNSIIEGRDHDSEKSKGWLSLGTTAKLFMVIPLVQFVYFWGVVRCLTLRRVSWRGIDYVIRNPFDIELVEYRPFCVSPALSTDGDAAIKSL